MNNTRQDSNCDHVRLWQYLDLCVHTKYWEEYAASISIASSLLRMEAAYFSETSISACKTSPCHRSSGRLRERRIASQHGSKEVSTLFQTVFHSLRSNYVEHREVCGSHCGGCKECFFRVISNAGFLYSDFRKNTRSSLVGSEHVQSALNLVMM